MSNLLELIEGQAGARTYRELPSSLETVLDDLADACGADRALMALYDAGRNLLHGALSRNTSQVLTEALEVSTNEAANPLVSALRTGIPQRVDSTEADQRINPHDRDVLSELGFTQFVIVPLFAGALGVGVILISRPVALEDSEIAALLPAANRAGAELARLNAADRLHDTSDTSAAQMEWLWYMVNAAADPVVVSDEQNEIILQNRSAEQLFRSRPHDSSGKQHAITMNNFLFTALLSTWNLQRGEATRTREMTLVDPIEGVEAIFEVIAVPAMNYQLEMRGTVSVLKNVTDLRHVSEELTRNAQRLQSADQEIRLERDRLDLILRNVPNPIIVINNENAIVRMNQAAQDVFGTDAAEGPTFSPRNRRAELALRNNAKFTSFVAQLRLGADPRVPGELALVDPQTEEHLEMSVTSSEILDQFGIPTAMVSVLQDVGRLRELERRRLEQALFESEKLAATGRLAASIAHEINNPLEAIQNSLYLLVHKVPADDPNHRFLEIAMKETERMSRILRQMLGFYRPVAALAPTNVNDLIDETGALVSKRLRDRGVRLEKKLDSNLPLITASADQLKQVLLNLILNASEASPSGGAITVSTLLSSQVEPQLARFDSVQIQITDAGTGIGDEHLPHIFEPFFSTKGSRGTGLGLWVSSGIVQSHGGTLQVRSRVDVGTTFSITLPIGGPQTIGA